MSARQRAILSFAACALMACAGRVESEPRHQVQKTGIAVLPYGDSLTQGLLGDTGGWRARMQRLPEWHGVGAFVDPTGRAHHGVGGRTLAEMATQFPADWAAQGPAKEVWICGGTNDYLKDHVGAVTLAERLDALLEVVFMVVDDGVNVRVGTPSPLGFGQDAVLAEYVDRIPDVVAAHRQRGRRVHFINDGNRLTEAGLDERPPRHPRDSEYGVEGYGLWARLRDDALAPPAGHPPDEVGGRLELWLRADAYLDGSWTDSSGNGRDAKQPDPALRPSLVDGELGQKALRFDGWDDFLRTEATFSVAQPSHIAIIVGRAGVHTRTILDSASPDSRTAFYGTGSSALSIFAGTTASGRLSLDGGSHLIVTTLDGTASGLELDGELARLNGNPGSQELRGITIGGNAAATPEQPWRGDIYEIAIWTGSPDLDAFTEYARARYGLWEAFGD